MVTSATNPSRENLTSAQMPKKEDDNNTSTSQISGHTVSTPKDTSTIIRMSKQNPSQQDIQHSINESELISFIGHINDCLKDDKHIAHRLPIPIEGFQVFDECKDGLILCKLINHSAPDTIDERVLNLGPKLSMFQITENNNVAISAAKAIGCHIINIDSSDIMDGRCHLVLGLIWQIIKIGLFSKVTLKLHPEISRLLNEGETLESLLSLSAESVLLRWFNYHLREAGYDRRVTNFGSNLSDSCCYTVLVHQLGLVGCTRQPLSLSTNEERAEAFIRNMAMNDCDKYVTAKSICDGNTNLNTAFIAHLFNIHPGLEPLSKQELLAIDESLFSQEGEREARVFKLWLNSLDVDPPVNNIFTDLSDGLVLLRAIDRIHPGTVEWSRVAQASLNRFTMLQNNNYTVQLCLKMGLSLVGVQGSDILDGVRTLILSIVWQLMRQSVIATLKKLSRDGKEVRDSDIIQWANQMALQGGYETTITNFSDPKLSSGVFLLRMIAGYKPNLVDVNLVQPGNDEMEQKNNAMYAISIARKLGCVIFLLPEDIIEVRPKLLLTFVGSLMATL